MKLSMNLIALLPALAVAGACNAAEDGAPASNGATPSAQAQATAATPARPFAVPRSPISIRPGR